MCSGPPLIVGVDANNAHWIMREGDRNYVGEVEQYVFCKRCEKVMSIREGYSAQLFNNTHKNYITRGYAKGVHPTWISYYHYERIKYQKLKLFILSLFWRVSTSNLPGFEHFSLGAEHNEKIAKMIYHGNPGKRMEYPFTETFVLKYNSLRRDRLYYPRTREPGIHTFFYSDKYNVGVIIDLFTETAGKEDRLNDWAFNVDGKLDCFIMSPPRSIDFYTGYLQTTTNELIPGLPPNAHFEGFVFKDAYPPKDFMEPFHQK